MIIAGIVCLVLIVLYAAPSWEIQIPAVLITLVTIYLTINLFRKQQSNPPSEVSVDHTDNGTASSATEQKPTIDSRATENTPDIDESKHNDLLLVSNCSSKKNDIRQHLESWGIAFTVSNTSARAFAAMIDSVRNQKPYKTVIVDQCNLDMDDCQFAIALRAEPTLQSLYLIHYGANIIPPRIEQLYTAGYSRVLNAPVDKTLLYNALHNAREKLEEEHNVIELLDHYESSKKGQPLEILIASGNKTEANKLRRILSGAGHQTFLVEEGAEILDVLDNHHFDLAILDADMPEVSGIEIIKLYRFTHLNQPWVPFILLLDSPNSQIIQACENADIDHLLATPVITKRLFESINQAIAQEEGKNQSFGYPAGSTLNHYHHDDLTLDTHQLEELKRLGKDKGFLMELINQFDIESAEQITGLKQAVSNHDIKSSKDYGHKLKDTAGNLGALNLYRLAVRITRITSNDSDFDLDNLVAEIESCRVSTIEALLDHLARGNNSVYRKE